MDLGKWNNESINGPEECPHLNCTSAIKHHFHAIKRREVCIWNGKRFNWDEDSLEVKKIAESMPRCHLHTKANPKGTYMKYHIFNDQILSDFPIYLCFKWTAFVMHQYLDGQVVSDFPIKSWFGRIKLTLMPLTLTLYLHSRKKGHRTTRR
jgi:hypothetical protein